MTKRIETYLGISLFAGAVACGIADRGLASNRKANASASASHAPDPYDSDYHEETSANSAAVAIVDAQAGPCSGGSSAVALYKKVGASATANAAAGQGSASSLSESMDVVTFKRPGFPSGTYYLKMKIKVSGNVAAGGSCSAQPPDYQAIGAFTIWYGFPPSTYEAFTAYGWIDSTKSTGLNEGTFTYTIPWGNEETKTQFMSAQAIVWAGAEPKNCSAHGSANLGNTLVWMGVEQVTDGTGNVISGYTFEDEYGRDWTKAAALADATGDDDVDVNDLLSVINAWGTCVGACFADINNDDVVDVNDLLMVINGWTG